jgi:hypothetical protein
MAANLKINPDIVPLDYGKNSDERAPHRRRKTSKPKARSSEKRRSIHQSKGNGIAEPIKQARAGSRGYKSDGLPRRPASYRRDAILDRLAHNAAPGYSWDRDR